MDAVLEVQSTDNDVTMMPTTNQIENNEDVVIRSFKKKKKKHWGQRDSLARRNKLLIGKEGSRRRQRWDNNQFNNHPCAILYEDDLYLPGYPHMDTFWTNPDVVWLIEESDFYDDNGDLIMNEFDIYISPSSTTTTTTTTHHSDNGIFIPHHIRQDLKKQKIPQGMILHYEQQLIDNINNKYNGNNMDEDDDLTFPVDNPYVRFLLHQMCRYYQLKSFSDKNEYDDQCYIYITLPFISQNYEFPDKSFFDYLFNSL
ncbi:unnamed protein product [Cunninghamella blakesleeana]